MARKTLDVLPLLNCIVKTYQSNGSGDIIIIINVSNSQCRQK